MNADQALRVSRILAMSLLLGVLLFAGVVYAVTGSGPAIVAQGDAPYRIARVPPDDRRA